MHKGKIKATEYQHGELISSLTVKTFYLGQSQSFLIDDHGNHFQGIDIPDLEENKSFELNHVIIERRPNFSFKYAIICTKQTRVNKLKKNLKKQFKKDFQSFKEAKEGAITNLKCMIIEKDGINLKLFDGKTFRMKLKKPINFSTDKLEILFVKKSYGYNYVWETDLTKFINANENDPQWKCVEVPEVKAFKDPNDIPMNEVGQWCAMLTTATPPFTYSKLLF